MVLVDIRASLIISSLLDDEF